MKREKEKNKKGTEVDGGSWEISFVPGHDSLRYKYVVICAGCFSFVPMALYRLHIRYK
jgi:hypothetical protein